VVSVQSSTTSKGSLAELTAFYTKLAATIAELEKEKSRFLEKQIQDNKTLLDKHRAKVAPHAEAVKKAYDKIPEKYRGDLLLDKNPGSVDELRQKVVQLRRNLEYYRDNN
jgi:molybdenum-dependent DNA-binding transcriptional regulator ModE